MSIGMQFGVDILCPENAERTSTDSEAKIPFMKTPQESSWSVSLF
jgi:hypothetical protein